MYEVYIRSRGPEEMYVLGVLFVGNGYLKETSYLSVPGGAAISVACYLRFGRGRLRSIYARHTLLRRLVWSSGVQVVEIGYKM